LYKEKKNKENEFPECSKPIFNNAAINNQQIIKIDNNFNESLKNFNFQKSSDFIFVGKSNNIDMLNNYSSTNLNYIKENYRKNSPLNNNINKEEKIVYLTQYENYSNFPNNLLKKYNVNEQITTNTFNSINKMFEKKNQGFYCPHCEHCNRIRDDKLEEYFTIKDAKQVIQKGFAYICEYYENDKSFLDFLINSNSKNQNNNININFDNLYESKEKNDKNETMINNNKFIYNSNIPMKKYHESLNKGIMDKEKENSHFPKGQSNKNNNMNIVNGELENIRNNKKSNKFDLENLLLTYPKLTDDRNVLQLVVHFLDALVHDKICLDTLVTPEILERLKVSLISQGFAFKANENCVDFDQEIENLFDEATKDRIKELFKSNLSFIFIKI